MQQRFADCKKILQNKAQHGGKGANELAFDLNSKLRHFVQERDEPLAKPEGDLDMLPAPALDHGMPVEVMKDFDTVLLFGRLLTSSPVVLTIGQIPGESDFPVCPPGSSVLVRGYDGQMDPILLLGQVVRSSGTQCVVGDLKQIPHRTQRKNVRHPLTPPANISALDGEEPDCLHPCLLLNLSTGGACIVAERSYRTGQALQLHMELSWKPGRTAVYPCQVMRATPRSGPQFEYGLSFTGMDEQSRGNLLRDIQAIHEEIEKKLLS